ncbi:protein CIP2A homolog [Procambarus clarkii]|uniref:protein CIP2A homolog n=1 Tax=Procambarus clarkii TaxID=6728 RepID=UPI001E67501F|nr:protein CIP2A homolog [Procambarus clarkii]XP_045616112.1 protein CIP2A homolog [Procambarus clarkii]
MGSTNAQIKNFISIAYNYRRSRTDKNLIQLQRHLQILSVVTDLSIFEPTCVETLEFYVCLEQFLNSSDAKSPVVWKVIILLAHISRSRSIREALRDDIKIVPILSDFLVDAKLTKDKSLKTLSLIEEISYKIKILRTEAWMLKLVPYLVNHITEGDSGDELLVPALTTLANLCRSNSPVLSCLRSLGNNKALVQKLTDMKTATINIKLLASELMFYLDLKETDGDFNLTEHILDLVFTAATEGFMENNVSWLRLAADVFGELVSCLSVEDRLREYKSYTSYLQPLISGMVENSPESLVEALLDLLYYIIELDQSELRPLYKDIFCKAMLWMHSERSGIAAVKVVQSLITVVGDSSVSIDNLDNFIGVVAESLKFDEDFNINHNRLHHINATLSMLEGLCIRDTAYRLKLAIELQPSVFSSLLRKIMSTDIPCLSSGSTSLQSFSDFEPNASRYGGSSYKSSQDISILSGNDLNSTFVETVSQAVVLILTVVKLLGSQNAEFMLEYSQMLNNPLLMTHLVRCQRSNTPELVAKAVTIISEGTVPIESVGALIKALEEANASSNPSLNFDQSDSKTRLFGSWCHPQLFSPGCEENVEKMISRLRGTVDKMELKDCALTDIMEMYEYKMAAMAHVETSLQNALTAADVQNRHTHYSLLQTRVQNDHLRSLLCSWEERLQVAQREKTDVQSSISQIQNSARQLRDNFRKEKTEMERQALDLQREASALRDHLDNREENIRRLQRQLGDAHNENKNLNKQIREEQEKHQKMQEQNLKLEEELKKGRRDYDDLQKENQRVEKVTVQLKKENSELELLIRSHEEAMSAKETELEEMTRKFNELKRIQDMIHNISSGKLGM